MSRSKRIALGVVGVIGVLWAILPDPLPILVDDIVAGLGGAASLLGMIVSFLKDKK